MAPVGLAICAGIAVAQLPFDHGRTYNRCVNEAYRRAGPAPRQTPRPGEDLVALERQRRDHEDRYYRYLDDCLRTSQDPRPIRRP